MRMLSESINRRRRLLVLSPLRVLMFVSAASCTPAQLGSAYLGAKLHTPPPSYNVHIDRHVAFQSSDGTELATDIYHPIGPSHTPTILVRIPYSKTLYNELAATLIGTLWAERGYTAVIQGTRGRFDSGGDYYPLWYEREDGIATLHWLKHQPWFNGQLAAWGGSYFGYTQWVVSDQTDPAPSAMMIELASSHFYDMFYRGGAFSLESALYWAAESRARQDVDPDKADLGRGYDGFPLVAADDRAIGDVPFFDAWVNHPSRDWYWKAIDGEDRIARVRCPVFMMAGWSDPFLPAQLHDYAALQDTLPSAARAQSHLVIGPWAHAFTTHLPDGSTPDNYRLESLRPSIQWFDQVLGRAAPESFAPVRIFVMGRNQWRDENEWPLKRTRYEDYYLRSSGHANSTSSDGELSREAPGVDEPADHFNYDPLYPAPTAGGAMIGPNAGYAIQNDIEDRNDVLNYSTPPLASDTEVTGPIKAILFVSTDAPSTDFTAKLVGVHPDGQAWNVSDGIVRCSNRGSEKVEPIEVELWPASIVFTRGDRIRLEVSSSNYPRYDRNPNTGGNISTETHPRVAMQTVYHSKVYASHLVLPIIPQ
jgi:putative CocE/NonD family hydrolase